MDKPGWAVAFRASDIGLGEARVFKQGEKRIAVFHPAPGELYAVDNQCPHEGYPLAKGYVKDCIVTCPWHNYKFDLRDGRCVVGEEAVRTYPVRVAGGDVEIDVTDPSPEEQRPRLLASVEKALSRHKLGQAARDVVRLLSIGTPIEQLALLGARFDAEFAEYGTTHATAMAVTVLPIAERLGGVEAALALMQAFEIASESHQYRPPRIKVAAADPGEDPRAAGARLRELVEVEDAEAAEALLRGALDKGWGRETIEPWFYRLCADHFLDFGHPLIYQVKIFDLLERVGWRHASDLLPAHLFGIVRGTREDALPEWKWLEPHLARLAPRFASLARGTAEPEDRERLIELLLDAPRDEMIEGVERALMSGTSLSGLVDALSIGAARRMLRFDVAFDGDPTVQDDWLDVTHILTYANAVRRALERYNEPEVVRLVLFGCRFLNNARPLDLAPERRPAIVPAEDGRTPASVLEAIATKDASLALARAAAYLAGERDPSALRVAIEDLALADALTRPIVVAHLYKTCAAAFEEHAATGRLDPLLALVRFAASPIRERRLARLTHEAIRFVVHGKVPRTLT